MKIIVADAQKAKRMSEEYVNETSLKHLSEARERSRTLDLHDTSVLGFHDGLVTSFPWSGSRSVSGIQFIFTVMTDDSPAFLRGS